MRICVGEEEKYGKHLEDGRGPDQSCKQGDDAPLKTHAKWERSFGYHGSEGLVLLLSYSDQPGEGLVDDKKNSVNHSGGGPNDDDSCGPGGGPTNDDSWPRKHRHQAGLRCLSMVGFTSARFAI
jgi:hypothetical protein